MTKGANKNRVTWKDMDIDGGPRSNNEIRLLAFGIIRENMLTK